MNKIKISKKNSVRVEFLAGDASRLDEAILKFMETVKSTGGYCSSVVRLPNRDMHLLVLNRSPHIYSCSKDQYKQKRLKAVVDMIPGQHTMMTLKDLVICGGVQVKMTLNNYEEGRNG